MATVLSDVELNIEKEIEANHVIKAHTASTFLQYMKESLPGVTLPPPFAHVYWSNGVMLFGCASTWFLLDIAFYSQACVLPRAVSLGCRCIAGWGTSRPARRPPHPLSLLYKYNAYTGTLYKIEPWVSTL